MNLAQVVVYFIGLCVVFPPTSSDPTMHVALIRVPPSISQNGTTYPLPTHQAVLLFRNPIAVYGWDEKPTPLPDQAFAKAGWEFVKLDGEEVTLSTSDNNPRVAVPAHSEYLGHLKEACGPNSRLAAGYTPPSFSSAAAVVNVQSGTVEAVKLNNGMRVDTRLTLNSTGPLVVTAYSKAKHLARVLVLPSGSCLLIMNFPASDLGLPSNAGVSDHIMAYQVLSDGTSGAPCNLGPRHPLDHMVGSTQVRPEDVRREGFNPRQVRTSVPALPVEPSCNPMPFLPTPVDSTLSANSRLGPDCSNDQWP